MALSFNRIQGCSGCLIEAIQRADESTLRSLLSDNSIAFHDTFWTSQSDLCTYIASFTNCRKILRVTRCTHLVLDECLFPGNPPHVAQSVVFTAMMHTTRNFNALQILAESQQFDLSKSLVFHYLPYEYRGQEQTSWNLTVVDPAALALLIDSGSDFDDPNSFPLLKTLMRNSLLKPDMELRIIEFESLRRLYDNSNEIKFNSLRSKDALSFLFGCVDLRFSLSMFHKDFNARTLLLLRFLADTDLLILPPGNLPLYFLEYAQQHKLNGKSESYFYFSTTFRVLTRLFRMFKFDALSEFYVSEWLRSGWICVQNDESEWIRGSTFLELHATLEADCRAAFRLLRQLLALGLFRELFYSYLSDYYWRPNCYTCWNRQSAQPPLECLLLVRLKNEFFRKPLSLKQLSRRKIRCAIGAHAFERRVKSLPLPPPLLTYVWMANEMLADV